jgi:GNAT superfamily N-acetyltransferase
LTSTLDIRITKTLRRKAKKKPAKRPRYHIRKVDPIAYAETIAAMLGAHFGSDAGTRPTAFIGMSWWIAFVEEVPVGLAGMCHSAIEEGSFYLSRSCVETDHRGHGLQRKLIMARVARAKELKGVACTSDTYENPPSTNNLIACGFRAYRPSSPWRGEGTSYWRLPL